MPVVADVDADVGELRLEDRISEIARLEVELLPEPGRGVRDVALPVLTEIRAVGVDHRRSIVVDAGSLFLVDGDDDYHSVLFGDFLHDLRRRPVRNLLYHVVPLRILLGTEVRAGEDLLHADDLHTLLAGLIEKFQVLLDVGFADRLQRLVRRARMSSLNQSALYDTRHPEFSYGLSAGLATLLPRINSQ